MVDGLLLGLVLGGRHAFDPDHLAAVATLVARDRSSRRAALLGAYWGAGHTITLVLAASLLVILDVQLPDQVGAVFELAVAAMLIALGVRALRDAFRKGGAGARSAHSHGALTHAHPGSPDHIHVGRWTLARRPLLIGLVHGLAGSGALTSLVLARMVSASSGIVEIMLFALGSLVAMVVLTWLAGWPVARLTSSPRLRAAVVGATGAVSLVLGAIWAWAPTLRLLA